MSVRRSRQPRGDTGATGASPSFSGAHVTSSGDQTIVNDTDTAVLFDVERYDTSNYHSTLSNTSRLTVTDTGIYLVGCNVKINAAATGSRAAYIFKNATTTVAYNAIAGSASFAYYTALVAEVQLTAADYVELWVYQNSGGDIVVDKQDEFSPELWISKR